MTDTPLTDAELERCGYPNSMWREWVSKDFARQLERENAALKARAKELEERLNAVEDDIQHRIDE